MMREAYVGSMRRLRSAADRVGIISALDRRRKRPVALWARSLFAIHDAEDLIRLDVPWWTLRSIDFVDAFLRERPEARVFEYGSGASTVFLARRAAAVYSVEHHAGWAKQVQSLVADYPHVQLMLEEPAAAPASGDFGSRKRGHRNLDFEQYVKAIDRVEGSFDLIVIDGRCRERCLEYAQSRLAPGGMIVFDNTGRSRYRGAISQSGLCSIETRGLTIGLPYPDHTTLLFADDSARDAASRCQTTS